MYIKYLYYGTKPDIRFLIGSKIITEGSKGIGIQEIYVGEKYSLDLFLSVTNELKINTSKRIIVTEYKKRKATGIIYFSNIKKFGFLNKGDIVVSSIEELNTLLNCYKHLNDSLKRKRKHIL